MHGGRPGVEAVELATPTKVETNIFCFDFLLRFPCFNFGCSRNLSLSLEHGVVQGAGPWQGPDLGEGEEGVEWFSSHGDGGGQPPVLRMEGILMDLRARRGQGGQG